MCGDFKILEDEQLSYATDVIDLLLKRFKDQEEEFKRIKPFAELGLIQVQFKDIKTPLVPQPKKCLDALRKMLPFMVRMRVENCKTWMLDQK